MTTTLPPTTVPMETVADLIDQLGGIPPSRIRIRPLPGSATERDVIEADAREGRLCELVEGTLVEKGIGYRESVLAFFIAGMLDAFVRPRNLGLVSGESAMMRLFPGLVRIPDVAFASWDSLPGRRVPTELVPQLAADLVVEVLSGSNTRDEMRRKRREYFSAGVRLVWEVDPDDRTVAVYTGPEEPDAVKNPSDTLDGGAVLPGFGLRLQDLFVELDRRANP
jgi:Uma2 family endonuclease